MILDGIIVPLVVISEFDDKTSKFIFDGISFLDRTTNDTGCGRIVPDLSSYLSESIRDGPGGRRTDYSSDRSGLSSINVELEASNSKRLLLETNFIANCRALLHQLLSEKSISREHVTDLEPYLILGIPSRAIFSMVAATSKENLKLTTEERRSNGIVNLFYPRILKLKHLIDSLQLSEGDLEFIKFKLVPGNADPDTIATTNLPTDDFFKQNRNNIDKKLMAIVSISLGIGIDFSRTKFMMENLPKIMDVEAPQ